MKNIKTIIISIFLVGILLIGVGVGIAFGEYSSFQYGGEKYVGTENTEEIVLEYEINTGKNAKKLILVNYLDVESHLEEDKKVPEGIIQYVVEYNPDYVVPNLYEIDYDDGDYGYFEEITNEYKGELVLSGQNKIGSFGIVMKCKDEILNELKNKTISSYEYSPWKSVTVKVNPKTAKYIEERM